MPADLPRICFIAGTLGRGGAERQLFYQLRALVAGGARPRLLALTQDEAYAKAIGELGVSITYVGAHRSRLRRLRAMIQALRGDRPDIVQSAHFFTNLYAVGTARRLGGRAIGAVRSDVTHELESHGWLGRRGLFWPRTLAVNTRAAIEAAVGRGVSRTRLVYLPNAVDTTRFTPRGQATAVPGLLRILFLSRWVEAKRMDRLVAVLARLKRQRPDGWHATLVGDGPCRAAVLADLEAQGLTSAHVTVAQATDDPRAHYEAADVLLLTSDHEGCPNVVLEAMACGLAVVATQVGGLPELVQAERTGLRFDPADLSGMVRGLTQLMDAPKTVRTFGQAGRAYVEATHSTDRLLGDLESLYQHTRR